MKHRAGLLFLSLLFLGALGGDLSKVGGFFPIAGNDRRPLKSRSENNRAINLAWVESRNNRLVFHSSPQGNEYSNAVRKVNGEIVQLWKLWLWRENATLETQTARPLENWVRLSGEVFQTNAGKGVLVRLTDKERSLVFFQNYPYQLRDGDRFSEYATRSGMHTYTTVIGSTMTVPAYDYGSLLTEKEWEKEVEAFDTHANSIREAHEARTDARKSAEARKVETGRFKGVKLRAESGSAEAMLELAELYRKGIGTETNEVEAAKWQAKSESARESAQKP